MDSKRMLMKVLILLAWSIHEDFVLHE